MSPTAAVVFFAGGALAVVLLLVSAVASALGVVLTVSAGPQAASVRASRAVAVVVMARVRTGPP